MNNNQNIEIKKDKQKQALLDQLKRTPTVELSCNKCGVSRATYYRWRRESKKFANRADEAIVEGRLFISDIAESQIFSLIRDRKFEAIRFWLANNEPRYSNKLEIKGHLTTINAVDALTPEQKKLLRNALKLALPKENYEKENKLQASKDTGDDDEGSEL